MRRSQTGFTLVELLLAVTLMATLLALAYGGLRAASRASESGQQMLSESSRLRITHQFIRKPLNLMLPLAFETDDNERGVRYTFEGGPERIIFVGPMPGYLARGGPQVQVLEFVAGDGGLQLQFAHAPLQGFERDLLLDVEPVVLLEGLQSGSFEFLELDEEEQTATWSADWPDPGILPKSVRMDLAFAEDATVHWPSLTASTRLDPSAVIPGAGGNDTYAEKIRDMIRRQAEGERN